MKSRSPSKISQCYLPEDKLKIIIRIRPILNEEDPDQFVKLEDDHTIQIRRPGNHSYMKFNNILDMDSTQKDSFNLVQDSIRQFLQGINITIFAYGQTGAGKTYSMIGNYSPHDSRQNLFNFLSSKERGILSRSLEMIMTALHESKNGMKVYVSFFEIYNEKIYDLYNNTLIPLDIRELKNGQISIHDLSTINVTNMEDAIQYLMVGLKNRATGSTHANAKSSRSHSIFQINLEKSDEKGEQIYSSLRIVDLAGSQKFKIPSDLSPSQKQIRIQELTNINGSLSCLGHCISALIEKSRTHIPFRNSKLTRILSDSLIGQGKMRFIICISPSISASAETFSTLQFANRAKKAIFERAEMRSPNLSKKKSENEEITFLKKELEREKQQRMMMEKELKGNMGGKINTVLKQNELLRKENDKLRLQVEELQRKSQKSKSPRERESSMCSNMYFGYQQRQSENDFKEQMLKLPIFQNSQLDRDKEIGKENKIVRNMNGKKESRFIQKEKPSISQNKKKAEFEKKIKKFIQADSPPQSNPKAAIKKPTHHYSFYPSDNIYQKNEDKIFQNEERDNFDKNDECDDWVGNEDTQEIIQKACQKMNIPDFKDLKNEMERAKYELEILRKKDDELSIKKTYN